MSQSKATTSSGNGHGLLDRARGVVDVAVPAGQRASDSMASATKKGLHQARSWSAPRIEDFAGVVETRITPAVTSSLRSSAGKIRPQQESRISVMRRGLLSWRGLMVLVAVLGAIGATAGIAMRKRYSDATAEAEKAGTDSTSSPMSERAGESSTDDYRIGSGSNW